MPLTESVNQLTYPPLASVQILGSRVHLASASLAVDQVERWIEAGSMRCRRVTVTGFHGVWEAYKDPAVWSVLNSADLWIPDGIAPVWAARLHGYREVERAPGVDIMREFLARAHRNGNSSYFYGNTDETLTALCNTVTRDYPGHRIAGSFSPPFRPLTDAEDNEIIDRINAAKPDILWVSLGMPKQDIWIFERLSRLKVPVAIGVGAAFAFLGGTVPRCPDWIGRMGFEWIYRFAREPRKLWRRDLLDGPRFLYHVGKEFLRDRESVVGLSSNVE